MLSKRSSLRRNLETTRAEDDLKQLKDMGTQHTKELQSKRPPVADDWVTTAIHIPKWALALLRNAAVGRAG